MDRQILEGKLKRAKLVLGDVSDTCSMFFKDYNPAPIGAIFYDLDYYSSTKAALTLLTRTPSTFYLACSLILMILSAIMRYGHAMISPGSG